MQYISFKGVPIFFFSDCSALLTHKMIKLGTLFPLPSLVHILRGDEPYPLFCDAVTKHQVYGHALCVQDSFDPTRNRMILSFSTCNFHPDNSRVLLSERTRFYV